MAKRNSKGALSTDEKRVVKAFLAKGWRNQDIQAVINVGRVATINSARITEVKQNNNQRLASDEELEFFQIKKRSYDPQTGLNLFDDERLIRAREAMILAVQIFNSAGLRFKTEVFSVLANIAWTYLLHEFYARKGVKIIGDDNRSLLLSQMIEKPNCPLTVGMKENLRALKLIRDNVEHTLMGKADAKWLVLFQACCLNFDKVLREQFGERLSLGNELSVALQFARMSTDHLATLNKYEIPDYIEALDARIRKHLTDEQQVDLDYQFRVVYTLDAATKSRAHFEFVKPESAAGKEIKNVLVQYKTGDHFYPHKPQKVCDLVRRRCKKRFTLHNHTQAWHLLKARPKGGAKQPENTNKEFCLYHPAHGDYTYSDKWVETLVEHFSDSQKCAAIMATRVD